MPVRNFASLEFHVKAYIHARPTCHLKQLYSVCGLGMWTRPQGHPQPQFQAHHKAFFEQHSSLLQYPEMLWGSETLTVIPREAKSLITEHQISDILFLPGNESQEEGLGVNIIPRLPSWISSDSRYRGWLQHVLVHTRGKVTFVADRFCNIIQFPIQNVYHNKHHISLSVCLSPRAWEACSQDI